MWPKPSRGVADEKTGQVPSDVRASANTPTVVPPILATGTSVRSGQPWKAVLQRGDGESTGRRTPGAGTKVPSGTGRSHLMESEYRIECDLGPISVPPIIGVAPIIGTLYRGSNSIVDCTSDAILRRHPGRSADSPLPMTGPHTESLRMRPFPLPMAAYNGGLVRHSAPDLSYMTT